MIDKLLYNTTLSQAFSPCGNFLVSGNIYGHIAVYDLQSILNPGDSTITSATTKPVLVFSSPREEPVGSLVSSSKHLISGTVGEITGYDWKSVTTSKHPKIAWSIQIPTSRESLEKADINSLVIVENNNEQTLIAGCGDKKIHLFNIKNGKHIQAFEGHEDYIHSVYALGSQLVSAGEDGKVCLWDIRQSSKTNVIEPYLNNKLARPHLGKWIGDACISEDWLVCGGGPHLSLWHLRSLDLMTKFSDIGDSGIHVTRIYDDRLLAGGTSPFFFHLSLSGEIYTQLETSALTVYSSIYQEEPHKVMCLAGSSPHIDLCTNFSYRDQILTFEEPVKL